MDAYPMVFLDLNGHRVEMDDDTAFALVMAIAAGTLDVPRIVEGLTTR